MPAEKTISLLLRIGIAFSFIYVAFSAYFNPTNWIGFIPDFATLGLMSKAVFLKIHVFIDLALGLWLLSGRKTLYASVISALFLASIILFNLGSLDILYRDVSILLSAVALAVLSYEIRQP